MKSKWGCLLAAVGAVVVVSIIIVMALAGIYNSLVAKSQDIDAQWSQVETQYQRRYDLIPNLVNSVKGMMTQEQTVFQSIADARTKYGAAQTVNDKAVAAGEVETALGRLIAVMENYPELKSSQNVTNLMDDGGNGKPHQCGEGALQRKSTGLQYHDKDIPHQYAGGYVRIYREAVLRGRIRL